MCCSERSVSMTNHDLTPPFIPLAWCSITMALVSDGGGARVRKEEEQN